MPARTRYLSSILSMFSTFADRSRGGSAELSARATELLAHYLEWKKDYTRWDISDLEKFLRETLPEDMAAVQLMKSFITQFPPFQANVFLHEYLLALQSDNCSESTIRNYRSDIQQFLAFSQENKLDSLITKPKLAEFAKAQLEKGLKEASVTRKLSSICQFGQWAEQAGLLSQALPWLQNVTLEQLVGKHSYQAKSQPDRSFTASSKAVAASPSPVSSTTPAHQASARANQELRARLKNRWSSLTEGIQEKTKRSIMPYLNLGLIILFFLGLGVFGYFQVFRDVPQQLAYPTSLTRPNRELSFQGRLTDTNKNPITTASDMQYRLYDVGPGTGGTLLWDSGTCSVDPDQDGIFAVGLGDDCGSEIDSSVFSENANVWLEVIVESETLAPRQPIKTVPYALNSETLQGYPASASAVENTIPVMNNNGDIVLGSASPVLQSTNGTFTIEGRSLLFTTAAGSNGNIVFNADGLGSLISRDYISAPGATLSATYAGGTALVARGGPSGTANIQEWQNSAGTIQSVLTSSGSLGVGTSNFTDPITGTSKLAVVDGTTRLSVRDHATGQGWIALSNGTMTGYSVHLNTADGVTFGSYTNHDVTFRTNNVNRMRLHDSGGFSLGSTYYSTDPGTSNALIQGTLGLGTSGPDAKLDSLSTSGEQLRLTYTDGSVYTGFTTNSGGDLTIVPSGGDVSLTGNFLPTTNNTYNLGSDSLRWANIYGTNIYQNGNQVCDTGGNCSSLGVNYWRLANGAFSPVNDTADLLIGSNATASAKFGFLNVNSGLPTASISGTTANVATYLTGNGHLGTTHKQTLALGTASTGNVSLAPNSTETLTATALGRVGIGTTVPGATLDIRSSAIANNWIIGGTGAGHYSQMVFGEGTSGGNYAEFIRFSNASTNAGRFIVANLTKDILFSTAYGSNYRNDLYISSNGNIGVGTTSPLSTFDIRGNSGTTSAASVSAQSAFAALVVDNKGVGDIFTASSSGLNRFVITQNGNVGIGTTMPNAVASWTGDAGTTLNVNGGAGKMGTISLQGDTARLNLVDLNGGADDKWMQLIQDNGLLTFRSVTDAGNTVVSNNILVLDNSSGNVGIGNSTPTTKLDVTGTASVSSTLTVGGAIQPSTGNLVFNYKSGANAWSPAMTIDTVGNVGIGTTTPASKVDVSGRIMQTGSAAITGYLHTNSGNLGSTTNLNPGILMFGPTNGSSGNYYGMDLGYANSTYRTRIFTPNNQDIAFSTHANGTAPSAQSSFTDLMVIRGSTGRVGIGTSNPLGELSVSSGDTGSLSRGITSIQTNADVHGAAITMIKNRNGGPALANDYSGLFGFNFYNSASTLTAGAAVWSQIEDATSGSEDGNLQFRTTTNGTASEKLRITAAGNIGIGTITPLSTFDVRGNSGTLPVASISGQTARAALIIDNNGVGDIFTASKSGATKLTLNNNGNLTLTGNFLPGANNTYDLGSNSLRWANIYGTSIFQNGNQVCDTGGNCSSVNYWRLANGALSPVNDTTDLLIGSNATTSAKFAFINVNSGTPTATISGSVAGNGLSITGDGTISTTLNRSLALNPNGGNVGIGTSNPTSAFTVNGFGSASAGSAYLAHLNCTTANCNNVLKISSVGSTASERAFTVNDVFSVMSQGNVSSNSYAYFNQNSGTASMTLQNASGPGLTLCYGTCSAWNFQVTNPSGIGEANLNVTTSDRGRFALSSAFTSSGADNGLALVILNETGDQDILAASASGTTRFRIGRTGEIVSTNAGGNDTIFNLSSTGDLQIQDNGGAFATFTDAGVFTLDSLNLDGTTIGLTTDTDLLSLANNALTVNGTITSAGHILPSANNTYDLGAVGTRWANIYGTNIYQAGNQVCDLSNNCGYGLWQTANGALYPSNSTVDLLIGATATTSAKFGFLNVNSGTPTASVSASSGNIATYLTGDGTLATTNRQTLTIGNSSTYNTTGNVLINSNGQGNVGIGLTSPVVKLDVSGTNAAAAAGATPNGALSLRGGGDVLLTAGVDDNNAYGWIQARNRIAAAFYNLSLNPNGGNVGIGNSAPSTTLDVTGTASVSSTLSLGGALQPSTGSLVFNYKSGANTWSPAMTINTVGDVSIATGNLVLTNAAATTRFGGQTYTWPGSQAANYILQTNGSGTLSWVDPALAGAGSVYWNQANGALFPKNSTVDVLIGGQTTASAKIAFTGINNGATPTASFSGNLALAVPTGVGSAATFDIYHGGTLNFRNSPGGPLGATSRMFIAANGYVGIGNTDPDANLTITNDNVTSSQLRLRSFRTAIVANNTLGGIEFQSNDTQLTTPGLVTASITASASATHTTTVLDTDLVFQTMQNTSLSEVMRITAANRVGIGINNPTATLHTIGFSPADVGTATGTAGGSSVILTGAIGGNTTIATTGTGGAGGTINITSGTGGVAASALTTSTGGAGGTLALSGGTGGSPAVAGVTNNGGAGGAVTFTGGTGGSATGATSGTNTGGVGGALTIAAGTGGLASNGGTNNVGGSGGALSLSGGASVAVAGSAGGTASLVGAAGSSTGSGGNGGNLTLSGGAAGGDNTVARTGGTVAITAGASRHTSIGGAITLTAGAAGINTTVAASPIGAVGGGVTLTIGAGGTANAATTTSTGGAGGTYTITGGAGGAASMTGAVNNTGGAGTPFTWTSGIGGAANGNTTGNNTAGAGGAITLTAGNGGAASNANGSPGTINGGAGGAVTIAAGNAGAGVTSSGAGGSIALNAGLAAAAPGSAGGGITLLGRPGSATGSGGAGGAISITAGHANGDNSVARAGGGFTLIAGQSRGNVVGGGFQMTAGAAGQNQTVAATVVGPAGGGFGFTLGAGGTTSGATTTGTGGAAGGFTITGAVGGAGSQSGGSNNNIGGAGSAFSFTAGNGGVANGDTTGANTAGAGGSITLTAGVGGAATNPNATPGIITGGAGGAVSIAAGAGGAGTTNGGAGGAASFTAGSGNATGTGGNGGSLTLSAGNGLGDGSVNRAAGTVSITAGTSRGASVGGLVTITAGAAGTRLGTGTLAGAAGGGLTLNLGAGGVATQADVASTGGAGGTFTISGAAGGAASVAGTGNNTGGAGSAFSWTAGAGGVANGNTTGNNTSGAGGGITLTAGAGAAATNANGTPGNIIGGAGGGVAISGGAGGTGATQGGNGGGVSLLAGAAAASPGAAGGAITLTASAGSNNGTGGAGGGASLVAGAGRGNGSVARAGGGLTLTAGASVGNAVGGAVGITAGAAGNRTDTGTMIGAAGGGVTLTIGAGGTANAADVSSTGGAGGTYTITGGVGGAAAVAGTGNNIGGAGTAFSWAAGGGGAATGATSGNNTGGAGGAVTLSAGPGGAATIGSGNLNGGAGGTVTINAGAGGAGATNGGNGGNIALNAGLAAASAGSNGGAITLTARPGSATGTGGTGGALTFIAGAAGGDGSTARAGGAVGITAGASVGNTPGGTITLTAGAAGNRTDINTTATGAAGGGFTLTLGAGGTANVAATASTGGAAGAYTITGGTGGAAAVAGTGNNLGGVGSLFSWTAGTGGVANAVTSGTSTGGAGGSITLTAGTGGNGTNSSVASVGGAGGSVTIGAGTGGASSAGTGTRQGGAGGNLTLNAGVGGLSTGGTVGVGGFIAFQTGPTTALLERMRITNAGFVGIANTDPDANLTIANDNVTSGQIRLRSFRAAIVAGNTIGGISFASNDTNLAAPGLVTATITASASATHTGTVLDTDLVFHTMRNTSIGEAMRITAENEVGIGTSNPTATLHLVGYQPADVGTATGTAAGSAVTLTGGVGGYTTIATTGTGGIGGTITLVGGTGGTAASAATNSIGGAGGSTSIGGGTGAAASVAGTGGNLGGAGGALILSGGVGGVANGNTTGANTGGAGGAISLLAGTGGAATNANGTPGTRTGGAGGTLTLGGGTGGNGTDVVGAGGNLVLQGGAAGGASGTGGYIAFSTALSNTLAERMRILNNGYVGIGVTDADANLTIANDNVTSTQLRLRSQRVALVSGNTLGGIEFMSNDTQLTAPGQVTASITASASATHTTTVLDTDLVFHTMQGTTLNQSMRLTAAGNLILLNPAATTTFGGIAYTWPGTQAAGYVLQTNGSGTLSWQDPAVLAGAATFWNQANGLLFPKNSTVDVTFGGQATASAKFAFLNVNSGTPTASISANTTNNATTLTGTGFLGTTNRQTLTLGSSSTGDVVLAPGGTNTLYANQSGRVGINTSTPLAALDIRASSGTLPTASVSAQSTFASLVVDQAGVGDIFTASKSGATKFRIGGSGEVISTNTGTTDTIFNLTSTGDLQIQDNGGAFATFTDAGVFTLDSLNLDGTTIGLTTDTDLLSLANNALTVNGTITSVGNILPSANNTYDLGASGTRWANIYGTNIYQNGNQVCDLSNNCGYGLWRIANGAISPSNDTTDVLIGSNATASAKFGFLNVNSGTPVASISANSGNIATTLTGAGVLGTTTRQTLTLGSSSTGDVVVAPGGTNTLYANQSGRVGINTTTPLAALDIRASSGTLPTASVSGQTSFSTLIVDQSGVGDIFTASKSGATKFRIGNSGEVVSTNTGTTDTIFNLTSTGDLQIQDNGGAFATFTDAGVFTLDSLNLDGTTIGLTTDTDLLSLANNALTVNGTITSVGNILPSANNTYDLGASGTRWANIYGTNIYQNGNQVCDTGGNCSSLGVNYWRLANGAFSTVNDTADVLIGSNATASAKFAFMNVNSGTPTASISANSGNIATTLSGLGVLGTTNKQTLSLGSTSTGNVSLTPGGTTALTALATGNVGIGTTNPGTLLHVQQTAAASTAETLARFTVSDNATAMLSINNASSTDTAFVPRLDAVGSGTAIPLAVRGRVTTDTGTAPAISFQANNAAGGSITTRPLFQFLNDSTAVATVDANGNLGVGTTGPDAKIDSLSTSGEQLRLTYTDGTVYTGFTVGSGGDLTIVPSGGDVNLTGNFLPSANNTYDLGASGTRWANIYGTNIYQAGNQVCDTSGNCSTLGVNYWRLANGAFSTVNDTADVLIGSNATASAKFAFMNVNSGTPTASISGSSAGNGLSLTGDGTVATTLNRSLALNPSGGNVGVGTATPLAKLDVNGDEKLRGTLYFPNTTGGETSSFINTSSSNNMLLKAADVSLTLSGSGGRATLMAYSSEVELGTVFDNGANSHIRFSPGGSEKARITNLGNLGLGTTTPLARLDVRGSSGTTPVASVAGQTTAAALVVDNRGVGDLFTASSSGLTRFTIGQTGNLTINGTSHQFTGGSNTFDFFNGSADTTLTLSNSAGSFVNNLAVEGQIRVGNFAASPTALGEGSIYYDTDDDRLYYYTAAGWLYMLNSTDPTSNWTVANGAIRPNNSTLDLFIGGTSTASAKFAFINVNSGDPTATISGNLALTVPTGANPAATFDVLNGGALNFRTSPGGNAGLTSRLYIANNGNIGIGTASPLAKLDIAGSSSTISNTSGDITINAFSDIISFSGDSLGNILHATLSGQIRPGGYSSDPTNLGNNGAIYYNTTDKSLYYYNDTSWLRLAAGDVSNFWTVNPSLGVLYPSVSSLDVLVGGSTTASAKVALNAGTGYVTGQRFQDSANTAYYIDPAAAGTSGLFAGNVGIGDLTPLAQLTIGSDANARLVDGQGDVFIQHELEVGRNASISGNATVSGTLTVGSNSLILTDSGTYSTIQTTSGALKLQVGGSTAGAAGNSSIQFLDSSGTLRGRFETKSWSSIDSNFGTGSDGAVTISTSKNLNTDVIASNRSIYADGIAYRVVAPADSATSVTRHSSSDTVSNGLTPGDEVMIINMQGTSADNADVGNYEFRRVASVSPTTITFSSAITKSFDGSSASNQKVIVQRVPNYTNVTVSTGGTLTASAWDGLTTTPTGGAGYLTGVVAFRATGTVSIASTTSITASSLGYRGGTGAANSAGGNNAESYDGTNGAGGNTGANTGTLGGGSGDGTTSKGTTGTRGGGGGGGGDSGGVDDGAGGGGGGGYAGGGGGGGAGADCSAGNGAGGAGGATGVAAGGGGSSNNCGGAGAGGAAGNAGGNGTVSGGAAGSGATTGQGGAGSGATNVGAGGAGGGGMYGTTALTNLYLGSGGGEGGDSSDGGDGPDGGRGGGIVFIAGATISNSGNITTNGATGTAASTNSGGGGGGAGGSVAIVSTNPTLGTSTVTATGGGTSAATAQAGGGGGGGVGRIRVEYTGSLSGTTNPSASTQASINSEKQTSTVDTGIYGTLFAGAVNTYAADVAEQYPSVDSLLPGEVVIFDPDRKLHVKRATQAKDPGLIGIVSTDPGILLGSQDSAADASSSAQMYPVALSGRVPVSIASSSEEIKIGDYLTSSTEPGKAMKATEDGMAVARALEDWSPASGTSQIMAFVQVGEFVAPIAGLDDFGSISLELASGSAQLGGFEITESGVTQTGAEPLYVLRDAAGKVITKVGAFAKLAVGNLKAGFISAKQITTDTLVATQEFITPKAKIVSLETDAITPLNGSDLTIKLGEDTVATESGEVELAKFEVLNASGSSLLSINSQGDTSILGDLLVNGNIETPGEIIAQDLTITNNASVAGAFTAQSGRLDQLEAKLAELETINAQTANIVNATVSGVLYAAQIADFEDKVAASLREPTLLGKLSDANSNVSAKASIASLFQIIDEAGFTASGSGLVNKSISDLALTDEDVTLGATALFVEDYFKVNGDAYIKETLGVGQQLLIGEGTLIADGIIEFQSANADPNDPSTYGTLYIQPSGKGSLSIMAGLLTLDHTGLVVINGDLAVTGDLAVGKSLLTDLIRPTSFDDAIQIQLATMSGQVAGASTSAEVDESRFEIVNELGVAVATFSAQGKADFSGGLGIASEENTATTSGVTTTKTSGKAIIAAGAKEITFKSELITDKTLIYVTPISSTGNQVLYVKNQVAENSNTLVKEGQFTVGFDAALTTSVTFNWWIVN